MNALPQDAFDVARLTAHALLVHGRAEQALVLLRALCLIAPEDVRLQRSLSLAATRAGRPTEALRALDRLRDRGDPSPVVHLLQGQVMAGAGRHAEASRAFDDFALARSEQTSTLGS